MIILEASALFSELATTAVIDGVSLSVITDGIQQKRHEVTGLMVETMQLTAVATEIGQVAVGQVLAVDGVEWEVEAVQSASGVVVVSLQRYNA